MSPSTSGPVLATICLAVTTSVAAAPRTATRILACGPATLTAISVTDPHAPPNDDFAWLFQTLGLTRTPRDRPVILHVDQAAPPAAIGRRQALAAAVVSWACLTGLKGKSYVLLDLACARETDDGVCRGQREWIRIVGTDGSRPDAHYAPQDPRYPTLFRRLQISADNVQLTGIF